MTLTWSVANGGALCTCGHLKCSHEEGKGYCLECDIADERLPSYCKQFKDRAEEPCPTKKLAPSTP